MPTCKLCQKAADPQTRCAWVGPFVQNRNCATLELLWRSLLEGADKDHPLVTIHQTRKTSPGGSPVFRYAVVDVAGVTTSTEAHWQDGHLMVMGRLFGPKKGGEYTPESHLVALIIGVGSAWAPSEVECITLMGYLARTYREATP